MERKNERKAVQKEKKKFVYIFQLQYSHSSLAANGVKRLMLI